MGNNKQWKSRYLTGIGAIPIRAGIPNTVPDWEQVIPSGNGNCCLVDDSTYYHNGGARQSAIRLSDGHRIWDVESAARESTGTSAMVFGSLLVHASATLIRDKKTGELLADLKEALACPADTFGFGSFSYCYVWDDSILFLLQKPSYQYRLVDRKSFTELEWRFGSGYIQQENDDFVVFWGNTRPDVVEIYSKQENSMISQLQDPCFDFQSNQPKFVLHNDTLLVGIKSADTFKAWNVRSGELLWESRCPYEADENENELSIDKGLDGVVPSEDGFLVYRHVILDKRSLNNEIWHLDGLDGGAKKWAELDEKIRTRSGILAGSIFFLERKNDDGSFSPCAIDSHTGELLWQADNRSKQGYEILLSDQHVVYAQDTPEPCTVLCYSWNKEYVAVR